MSFLSLVVACLCCLLVVVHCTSYIQADADRWKNTNLVYRSGSSTKFCAYSNGSCDYTSYLYTLVANAIPGFVLFIIFLLFWPFWVLGRYCCNCCGGRDAGTGCCCQSDDDKKAFSGFASSTIMIVKLALLAGCVLCLIGIILGFVGNGLVSTGFQDWTNSFLGEVTNDANTLLDLINNIYNQTYSSAATSSVSSLKNTTNSVLNTANKFINSVNGYEDTRRIAFIVFFSLLLVLWCLTIPALILGWRQFLWPLIAVGFLFLALTWFIFGVHMPIGILTGDMCGEIDTLAGNSSASTGVISSILSCPTDAPQQIYTSAWQVLNQTTYAACAAWKTYLTDKGCQATPTACAATCGSVGSACYSATSAASITQSIVNFVLSTPNSALEICSANAAYTNDNTINNITNCASSCTTGNDKSDASNLLSLLQSAQAINNTLTVNNQFLNCAFFTRIYQLFQWSLCGEFLAGVFYVAFGSCWLGFFMTGGMVVIIYSTKVFNPENSEKHKHKNSGDDSQPPNPEQDYDHEKHHKHHHHDGDHHHKDEFADVEMVQVQQMSVGDTTPGRLE